MHTLTVDQKAIIDSALLILAGLFKKQGGLNATSAEAAKVYCQLQIGHLEHEVFGVLFLDNQHHLIKSTELFRGLRKNV